MKVMYFGFVENMYREEGILGFYKVCVKGEDK